MLGEFLSANVSTPFLLFMVEGTLRSAFAFPPHRTKPFPIGFGIEKSQVGSYTGILGASTPYRVPKKKALLI